MAALGCFIAASILLMILGVGFFVYMMFRLFTALDDLHFLADVAHKRNLTVKYRNTRIVLIVFLIAAAFIIAFFVIAAQYATALFPSSNIPTTFF